MTPSSCHGTSPLSSPYLARVLFPEPGRPRSSTRLLPKRLRGGGCRLSPPRARSSRSSMGPGPARPRSVPVVRGPGPARKGEGGGGEPAPAPPGEASHREGLGCPRGAGCGYQKFINLHGIQVGGRCCRC